MEHGENVGSEGLTKASDGKFTNPIAPWTIVVLCACLCVWVVSFFLRAATISNWGQEEYSTGLEMAVSAAIFFWIPIYGWSFFVNVFMLIAPFEIKRVRKGKGRVFACLFFLFAMVPLAIAFAPRAPNPGQVRTLEIGFYAWEFSVIAAASWFLWAVWRKSYLVLAGVLMAGSLVYAPTYQNRLRFAEIVEKTRAVIEALGVPGKAVPIGDLNMAAYRDLWRLRQGEARSELIAAIDYTQHAASCWDRERISDLTLTQMYPGALHLQSPDPRHRQQPPPSGRGANDCYEDNSATRPWFSGTEMREEALRRARVHLANAEIEIGLKTGSVQEPFPLSSLESSLLSSARR